MSARSISRKNKWLTVVNSMNPKEPTCIHVAGFIGDSWWDDSGTSEKDFRDALDAIPKGQPVTIRVNSEGGIIKDGLGIHAAVKSRAADITTEFVGYACSTASWAFLPASKVLAADNAVVMIHESAAGTWGNKRDHQKGADSLSTHDSVIAGMIAAKTGKSAADVLKDMESEKWMTGKEACDYGLSDGGLEEIGSPEDIATPAFNAPWMNRIPDRFKNLAAAQANQTTPAGAMPTNAAAAPKPISGTAAGANQEPKGKHMEPTTTATPAATPAATQTATTQPDNAALQKQVNELRKTIITNRVKSYNSVTNAEVTIFVNQAMNGPEAETAVFAALDEREKAATTTTANGIPHGSVTVTETPFENIKKLPTSRERYNVLKRDWDGLIADALKRDDVRAQNALRQGFQPANANTYSATLVTAFLIDGATTVLQNKWAALKAFSRDFSVDPYKPLATGEYKFVSAGPTVQTNPTNWESGDATVDPVTVAVNRYSSSIHVTATELNQGLRMENLVTFAISALADKIMDVLTTQVTLANFATTWNAGSNVCTAANFDFTKLQLLWAALQKANVRNLVLDGSYLGKLLNVPSLFQPTNVDEPNSWKAFGWDGIYLNSKWHGTDNIAGIALDPQALACIAGLPISPASVPGNTIQEGTFVVPGVQIGVKTSSWFALASRTSWMSYDLMFGAAKMDGTAGIAIATA